MPRRWNNPRGLAPRAPRTSVAPAKQSRSKVSASSWSRRPVDPASARPPTHILRSELHVDLRVVPCHSYGVALHYFTGPKTPNVTVCKLGVERALEIDEYGVFHAPKGTATEHKGKEAGKQLGGEIEENVFRDLAAVCKMIVATQLKRVRMSKSWNKELIGRSSVSSCALC